MGQWLIATGYHDLTGVWGCRWVGVDDRRMDSCTTVEIEATRSGRSRPTVPKAFEGITVTGEGD